ncbi:MAG: protocatechuate 4,5-dioxygenase subunit alpha [Gammaproteobacteria bacterium]|jgi:protocatechuate 4,5-dioxygenase alpha chain
MREPRDFDDIPGTYVFDYQRSHEGYHLNMFCMSLLKSENREEFLADEASYLKKFPMTTEQRQSVLDRNWLGMVKLGGNIYFTSKIGATLGKSFQYIAAEMSGVTQDEYANMMLQGGRNPQGNRSKSGDS